MKKHLANIISSSRIFSAILLFFFNEFTSLFIAIYVYCGFSDLIDGPVARKTGTVSVLGTRLDTIGDVLTYSALTKILVFKMSIPLWAFIWFFVNIVGFISAAIISKIKNGKFYFVHTLFCKIMGTLFFSLPFVISYIKVSICSAILCFVSSIAAGESIFVQLKNNDAETNVISIRKLLKEKENKYESN